MSFEAVNWAWKQRKLTVHEKMVLLALLIDIILIMDAFLAFQRLLKM